MNLVAAHINDAGIAVLDAGRLYYREPGFALLDDDELVTGMAAFERGQLLLPLLEGDGGERDFDALLGLPRRTPRAADHRDHSQRQAEQRNLL